MPLLNTEYELQGFPVGILNHIFTAILADLGQMY